MLIKSFVRPPRVVKSETAFHRFTIMLIVFCSQIFANVHPIIMQATTKPQMEKDCSWSLLDMGDCKTDSDSSLEGCSTSSLNVKKIKDTPEEKEAKSKAKKEKKEKKVKKKVKKERKKAKEEALLSEKLKEKSSGSFSVSASVSDKIKEKSSGSFTLASLSFSLGAEEVEEPFPFDIKPRLNANRRRSSITWPSKNLLQVARDKARATVLAAKTAHDTTYTKSLVKEYAATKAATKLPRRTSTLRKTVTAGCA
jgi:hypothetical protein